MSESKNYVKLPVTVSAAQWFQNGDHPLDGVGMEAPDGKGGVYIRSQGLIVRFFHQPDIPGTDSCRHCKRFMRDHGWIDTLEGGHIVCPGDWIITGVNGERYPCKPDIFEKTYRLESEEQDWIPLEHAQKEYADLKQKLAESEAARENAEDRLYCNCDSPYLGAQVVGMPTRCERCMKDVGDFGPTLRQQLSIGKDFIADLERWKAEQLAVESTWDVQAVARELGIQLGASIRAEILPAILAMKQKAKAAVNSIVVLDDAANNLTLQKRELVELQNVHLEALRIVSGAVGLAPEFWQGKSCVDMANVAARLIRQLDQADKPTADLLREIEALRLENVHICNSERFLNQSLNLMQASDFAKATDEELKRAMEYSDTCRCEICSWTRYELDRRAALNRANSDSKSALDWASRNLSVDQVYLMTNAMLAARTTFASGSHDLWVVVRSGKKLVPEAGGGGLANTYTIVAVRDTESSARALIGNPGDTSAWYSCATWIDHVVVGAEPKWE